MVAAFAGVLLGVGAACGTWHGPEGKCQSIPLGTPISSLPALPAASFTMRGTALVGPADELGCCAVCNRLRERDAGSPDCTCAADCAAYPGLVELRLGAPYDATCAEALGVMMCNVLVFDGGVVAVNGRCEE
jgi:hypothetical protein